MASSSSSDREFDVFLSFRGTDTRNTFTGHLNTALKSKGIRTFIDDKELRRGEDISSTLFTTIEKSRCSIVVLSEAYATSKWCLEELVKILECKRTIKQRVVPIFYHVDPSDVRGQGGSFGQAMDAHKKNLKIEEKQLQRWSAALTEVGNLSGWDLGNKSEAQLIQDIVADISKYLNCASSNDAQNLVGVDSCIKELESLLCFESTDVRMIGICGMSGIGKTALARSIYEQFSDKFEGCCFLTNVGNVEREGTDYWKKELLSSVLKDNDIDVTITSIKTRLGSKKVLIVVDNVSHQLTMKTLIGKHDWFGPQSRIIITTRNKRFLSGMDAMYEVQKLQDDKAIELFNHCAFRKDHPAESFKRFSLRFIAYAQGLPLALEVLGSSLYKKDQDYWKSKLDELEKTLDNEIQGVLQKSFDELNDNEKDIFLDIACFFKCSNKDHIMKILESCNLFPGSGIENLIDRFLITISCEKLEMHDLLQKMGWKIVTQTSKEPGKRSRLWMQDDTCHVLEKNTGTKEVKGIFLNLFGLKEIHFTTEAFARMNRLRLLKVYESNLSDDSDSESTSRKRKCKVRISDDFEFHSDELRYLYWHEYPLQTLPSHFKPKNLVCLCMPYSQITELWKGSQVCENLKFLDLSNSKFLMETPDFSRITNLEELVLDGCTNLCHLHSSLGCLRKLAFLSVSNCIKLRDFPAIYELVSLQTLDLSGCSNLQKFPDISQHMPCLSKLYLDGTAITEIPASIAYASELVLLDLTNCKELKFLPSSIAKLTLLRILTLSGCSKLGKFQQNSGNLDRLVELKADRSTIRQPPSSGAVLRNHKASASSLPRTSESISFLLSNLNLVRLNLSDCNIKSGKRLSHLGILSSLKSLNLSGNRFIHLPCIFEGLSNLSRLDLHDCRRLQTLPLLPPSVRILNASNCTSLESILPESVFMSFRSCLFGNCLRLMKYPSTMEPHIRSMATHVDQERWRSTYDEEYPSFAGIPFSNVVPGSGIPDWFRDRREGHDINIEVHQNWYSSTPGSNNNFLGLALSAVVAPQDGFLGRGWYPYCDLYTQNDPKSESSHICSFTDGRTYQLEHTPIESDHPWLAYVPSFFSFSCEKWSCIKFSFGTSGECVVKSCGVCPVYIKDTTNDHNKPMGSTYTDINDSVLQATRIRSVGNSRTDSHAPDPERLERQRNLPKSRTRIDRNIQVSIPSGSARKFEVSIPSGSAHEFEVSIPSGSAHEFEVEVTVTLS